MSEKPELHEVQAATPQLIPASAEGKSGLVTGTMVLTAEGEVPVEFLSPGDRIITRDAGLATLSRLGRRRLVARAVRIAAGSLGDTRPEADLIVPSGQRVLIRDWRAPAMFGRERAMARAGELIDGEFITDLGLQKMLLHQLCFDTPHVFYGGGLELSCNTQVVSRLRSVA